jgi:hypothetical protein
MSVARDYKRRQYKRHNAAGERKSLLMLWL